MVTLGAGQIGKLSGTAGALVAVVLFPIWVVVAPAIDSRIVSRGFFKEVSLMAVGDKFRANLSCSDSDQATAIIRAMGPRSARKALAELRPNCSASYPRVIGKAKKRPINWF